MGQDHAPAKARLNGRIRQHGGKVAEDDALGGRAPARIGRVLAIEAVNLPVGEPGRRDASTSGPAPGRTRRPSPGARRVVARGQIDAVALGDLLLDVEVELAHDGSFEHTRRPGRPPRGDRAQPAPSGDGRLGRGRLEAPRGRARPLAGPERDLLVARRRRRGRRRRPSIACSPWRRSTRRRSRSPWYRPGSRSRSPSRSARGLPGSASSSTVTHTGTTSRRRPTGHAGGRPSSGAARPVEVALAELAAGWARLSPLGSRAPPGHARPAVEPNRPRGPGRAARGWLPGPVDLRPPRGRGGAPGLRSAQHPRRPDPVAGGQALRRSGVDAGADHHPSRRPAPGSGRSHGAHGAPHAPSRPDARQPGRASMSCSGASAPIRPWPSRRSIDCWRTATSSAANR